MAQGREPRPGGALVFELDGLEVSGVSVGGVASCVDLPGLKVCVDLGVILDRTVARDVVLITHAHADHLGSLVQHVAQRGLRGLPAATYVVPPGIEEDVEALLHVWRRLDGGELAAKIHPLPPGEALRLRPDLQVRPFATAHRVPSQGYFFERVGKRLADSLTDASREEIRALREAGETVHQVVHEPLLAITGDTSIDGLRNHPEVMAAPRLIVEATFLDSRVTAESAARFGHIHLDELAALADQLTCRHLLINHVSARHGPSEARRLVAERLPAELAARTQVMVSRIRPSAD